MREIERVCGEVKSISIENRRLCITVRDLFGLRKCWVTTRSSMVSNLCVGDRVVLHGILKPKTILDVNIKTCIRL